MPRAVLGLQQVLSNEMVMQVLVEAYINNVLGDPVASKFVDGTAFHLYGGETSVLMQVPDPYPKTNL
jgi:O-glycosyl hydrolase